MIIRVGRFPPFFGISHLYTLAMVIGPIKNPMKLERGFAIQKPSARGGYEMCPPPYKTQNQNFSKHGHVAYQNDRIEMLIKNLKLVFKNIAPSSNRISLST